MITTIVFDLGEVFLQGSTGSAKFVEEKLGLPVPDYYFYEKEFDQLMIGEITEDVYWEAIIKTNSWNIPIQDLKDAMRKNFREIEGMRNIVKRLKRKGYKMGLLSNHAREWIEYCEEKYKYHKLFHHVLYSWQIGIKKPDKKIFTTLLSQLHTPAEECLFIDDYEKSIVVAKNLGIKTILFTTIQELKLNLEKLGI